MTEAREIKHKVKSERWGTRRHSNDHCPCNQLSTRVSSLFCKINLRHDLKQQLKLMLKSTS